MAHEIAGAGDLAAAKGEQLSELACGLQLAGLADDLDFSEGEYGFAEVSKFVVASLQLLESFALIALPNLPGSGKPAKDAVGAFDGPVPLELRIEQVDPCIKVVTVPGLYARLNISMFSTDIAYSRSPAASRAERTSSLPKASTSIRTNFPLRILYETRE